MNKIKDNKTLKYSLFFGFYLIFFIVLFIFYQKNSINIEKKEENLKEVNIYEILRDSIKKYHENNYQEKIIINDKEVLTVLIDNPNYKDNQYSYFFDLYNLNKLIKNSKLEKKEDNTYYFTISNKDLNDILEMENEGKDNNIVLELKDNKLIKTKYDLSNYYGENVIIEIEYIKGDKNENSSS